MVRLLLILFLFLPYQAFAEQSQDAVQVERANVGFNIFSKVCFMMQSESGSDKRIEFLNSKFPTFEDEKAAVFKDMFRVENGTVWAANFPKGNFVVVVDSDTDNCHLLAQKADAETLHENLKGLYNTAQAKLDRLSFRYHPPALNGKLKSSGFEILGPNERVFTIVTISTALNPQANKPESLMSLVVQ